VYINDSRVIRPPASITDYSCMTDIIAVLVDCDVRSKTVVV